MRKKPVLMATALGAVLFLGGMLAFSPAAESASPTPVPVPVKPLGVIAAGRLISEGEFLRKSDLKAIPLSSEGAATGAVREGSADAERLVGSVLRHTLAAGELIQLGDTVAPGDRSFLAAIIRPGHRAVALGVDAVSSVSGLVSPGDRVDIMLTQELKQDGVSLSQSVVGETVLRDVRVLSIDQRLETPSAPTTPTDVTKGAIPAAASAPHVPGTITVETTPEGAEQLAVAATLGKLHLGLRSVFAVAERQSDHPTWAGAVSPALAEVHAKRVVTSVPATPLVSLIPTSVRIFRGSGDSK